MLFTMETLDVRQFDESIHCPIKSGLSRGLEELYDWTVVISA